MKTIGKLSLIVVMLLSFLSVKAQHSQPLQFGVRGGINISNFGGDDIKLNDANTKMDDKTALVGYMAGITLDYELAPAVYLQTGLDFTTKGAKYETGTSGVSGSLKFTPMYLQVPVHVAFKLPITESTKIVLGGGAFAAYGVGGKVKSSINIGDSSADFPESDFFGDDTFKRFDFGLGINAGVELGKLTVGVGYDLGLANIAQSELKMGDITVSNDKNKVRTQNAYAAVGIRF